VEQFTDAERVEVIDGLAELAEAAKPRRFALYGLNKRRTRSILGWGLEFAEDNLCVFLEPPDHTTHLSGSAAQLLEGFSVIADVRLAWLD
jgi:hypothetical protein